MPRIKANPVRKVLYRRMETDKEDESILDDDEVARLERELEYLREEKSQQIRKMRRLREERRLRCPSSAQSSSDYDEEPFPENVKKEKIEPVRKETVFLKGGLDKAQQRFMFNIRRIEEKYAEKERKGLPETQVEVDCHGNFYFPETMAGCHQQSFINRMYRNDTQFGKSLISAPRNSIDSFDGDRHALKKCRELDEKFRRKQRRSEAFARKEPTSRTNRESSEDITLYTERSSGRVRFSEDLDDDVFVEVEDEPKARRPSRRKESGRHPTSSTISSFFDEEATESEGGEFADDEEMSDEEEGTSEEDEEDDDDEESTPLPPRQPKMPWDSRETAPTENLLSASALKRETRESTPHLPPKHLSLKKEPLQFKTECATPNQPSSSLIRSHLTLGLMKSGKITPKCSEQKVKTRTSQFQVAEDELGSGNRPIITRSENGQREGRNAKITDFLKPLPKGQKAPDSIKRRTKVGTSAPNTTVPSSSGTPKLPVLKREDVPKSASPPSSKTVETPKRSDPVPKLETPKLPQKEITEKAAKSPNLNNSKIVPSKGKQKTVQQNSENGQILTENTEIAASSLSPIVKSSPAIATKQTETPKTKPAPLKASGANPPGETPNSENPELSKKSNRTRKPSKKAAETMSQQEGKKEEHGHCHSTKSEKKKKKSGRTSTPYCKHCELIKEEKKQAKVDAKNGIVRQKPEESETLKETPDANSSGIAAKPNEKSTPKERKTDKSPREGSSGTKRRSATVASQEPEMKKQKLTDSDLLSIPASTAVAIDVELIQAENVQLASSSLPMFSDNLPECSTWCTSVDAKWLKEIKKAADVRTNTPIINVWVDNLFPGHDEKDPFASDLRRVMAQNKKARIDVKAGYDMSKQSSLMSFFSKTPKQEKSEENQAKKVRIEKTEKKMKKADEEKKVLKRSNSQTINCENSPVKVAKNTPKRAKVVVSSSSESEDDSGDEDYEMKEEELNAESEGSESDENASDEGEETFESTPQSTPKRGKKVQKTPKKQVEDTPKTSRTPGIGKSKREMAEIGEVSMTAVEEKMTKIMEGEGERTKKSSRAIGKQKEEETSERFDHESFEFLKPEKIRDAYKRPASDPEYDPKTLWVPPDFHQKQTPGHRQWWTIKSQHFDTIILFKVGKFYETYHMDAVEVVRALNIAFMRGSYAHAGFPEHAASKFADQLMNHGYKVARVEQTETPQMLEERNQKTKAKDKVVRREVCRVTSNGTRTYGVLDGVDLGSETSTLDPTAKYLLAVKEMHCSETGKSTYGVCMIDTTTAHIRIGQFEDDDYRSQLRTLLANVIVVQTLTERNCTSASTKAILNGILFSVPSEQLLAKKQFLTADDVVRIISVDDYYGSDTSEWPAVLKGMLDESSVLPKAAREYQLAFSAFGAIVWYLRDSLIDVDMLSMRNVTLYDSTSIKSENEEKAKMDWSGKNLILDGTALENLNIVPNGRDSHSTSLYYVINKCSTPFGRRLLRSWLLQPTCDSVKLRHRQDAIKWMSSSDATSFIDKATVALKKIPDLDRLLQKIHTIGLKYRAEKHPDSRAIMFDSMKTNQKKIGELLAAIDGFKLCNKLRKDYMKMQQEGEGCELLDELLGKEDQMEEVEENILYFEKMFDRTIALKDGKIVPNEGCDEEYDAATRRVKECLKELNSYKDTVAKKYSCSIKFVDSGKVKYLLEMPENTKVSSSFELKSRRKGFIRYSTPDSEELVSSLDAAEREKAKLGDDATRRVFEQFGMKNPIWLETVKSISCFDVLVSLATFSKSSPFDMCMPEFDFTAAKPFIAVERGVHPCLALQSRNEVTQTTSFIANSTTMGESEAAVMLLTGPNMGGKSTLMRQTAVLAILAHIGSMVPAVSMRLSPIDRIFTRIGANDRIMCGESTFFIELKETDIMLKNATAHSLLLIDELGRGTSTFDGTAIASAVLQNVADEIGCRTFFSTHYHSICDSFTDHPNVRLAHMKCVVDKENNEDPTMEDVTFLYELESGICPKSYGFYAAKLAGIDQQVVRNAYAESNKFASNLMIDPKIQKLIECARDESFDLDELKKMVEAI
ncbi:unnamed protein product [Caenorhabditis sp. 36 PRJEB53466]|nr:unnamed protein product [Caenorhabditis sp. 36 PRJEB53466]